MPNTRLMQYELPKEMINLRKELHKSSFLCLFSTFMFNTKKFLLIFSLLFAAFLHLNVSANDYNNIVIKSDASFDSIASAYSGDLAIKGESNNLKIFLPMQIILNGDLYIDNVTLSGECTIYACGFNLYIGEGVTSDSRLNVYGGGNGVNVASTNVELYGGLYKSIYGGGNNSSVVGDTHLVVGGNVNLNDGINDGDSESLSPCYIYGGCFNGSVGNSSNITFEGNAVSRYIYGAGNGNTGNVKETYININGGKVMNVYAGSAGIKLTNCNAHVTMTDGIVESIFGASAMNDFDGNTCVSLLGGEVTRRVYTGCYNDWNYSWKSSYSVNGNTCLIIGPNVRLNTKKGLSLSNQINVGVFAGSRLAKNVETNEINTVLFIDDCYSSHKNTLGEKSIMFTVFYSNAKYIADCGSGGTVYAGSNSGEILCVPKFGNFLNVNGNAKTENNVLLSESQTDVIKFIPDFSIDSASLKSDGYVEVNVTSRNVFDADQPEIFDSITDINNRTVAIYSCNADKDTSVISAYVGDTDLSEFIVKVYVLDKRLRPLCESCSYSFELT